MRIYRFNSVSSTQDTARELAEKGVREGVVVADTQTGGKGRLGRVWYSPSGGLWFSIILRPKIEPMYCIRLVPIFGLAVANAIRTVTGLDALIKWPNDVVIDGKKICGILIESETLDDSLKYVIIGVGINVNIDPKELPPDVRADATSLSEKLGKTVDKKKVLKELLAELKYAYKRFLKRETKWLDEYHEKSYVLGKMVRVTSNSGLIIHGIAMNIDEEGQLLLKSSDGTIKRLNYEEVARLRIQR